MLNVERKPRRTRNSIASRRRLLEVARTMFAAQGYVNTSMDDLTAQAELTRGALYHHFGSKEGLLAALVDEIDEELELRLQAAANAAPTPWEALLARCHGYLNAAREPEIRRIVLQDARAVLGDVSGASQLRSIGRIRDALRQLMLDGVVIETDCEVLARMLYGSVTEAAFWVAEFECRHAERLSSALDSLDVLLGGLHISPTK